MRSSMQRIGPFGGCIAPAFRGSALETWLADLPDHFSSARSHAAHGGAAVIYLDAPLAGGALPLAIKSHAAGSAIKSLGARVFGTSAARAWKVAVRLQERGVGTPEPVAWLELWSGGRCAESHFVTRRMDPVTNMRDALRHLLCDAPDAGRVVDLLAVVAPAVRAMHEAGVLHRDLGNQNILLREQGDGWTAPAFIDLSRARLLAGAPSPAERGCDLARIYLPTDLLRIFCEMYWGGRPPSEFLAALRRTRARFHLHSWSRAIRHPIREARIRRDPARSPDYPPPRDIWIWDEKSAQPINAWASRERNRLHSITNHALVASATLPKLPAIRRAYRALRAEAFGGPVELARPWGLCVEPREASWERERALIPGGDGMPLLIRLYVHKGEAQWRFALGAGRALAARGHPVSFALCQDRRAVREPAVWAAFCARVVPEAAAFAEWIEVGHAINRVKWGLWDLREYRRLAAPMRELKAAFPRLRWMGPAGIDFEYPQVLAALDQLPAGVRFDALSHHLYVDRRGAPENRQGRFAALEKFALARALARVSGRCADRLIVSEVNWPLADTGVYSPVCSPYLYPGQVVGAPNVDEETYARFMVRYLLQASCSGLVERVYWWRLAAHGFGLVDEASDPWRARPAYRAWTHLRDCLGEARFERNLPAGDGAYVHLFQRSDGERVAVGYAWKPQAAPDRPFNWRRAEDLYGRPLENPPVDWSGAPVYFRGVSA